MRVTPRDSHQERYRGVAILVDGSSTAAAVTPEDFEPRPGGDAFDMLEHKTGESLTGRQFKPGMANLGSRI